MRDINKQKGEFLPEMFGTAFLIVLLAVVGFAGWCAVEFILWLFSFVTITID